MAVTVRYLLRNDVASNWESVNPVLLKGEPALDQTNHRIKFGDGVKAWNDLPYADPDIINALDSDRVDATLSAAMGKSLKEDIQNVAQTALSGALKYNFENFRFAGNNFQVPDKVTQIAVSAVGGGGGGGGGAGEGTTGIGAGGSSGASCVRALIDVVPGEILTRIQGAGGAGGSAGTGARGSDGSQGGDTYLKRGSEVLFRLAGGLGGGAAFGNIHGGNAGNMTGMSDLKELRVAMFDQGIPGERGDPYALIGRGGPNLLFPWSTSTPGTGGMGGSGTGPGSPGNPGFMLIEWWTIE